LAGLSGFPTVEREEGETPQQALSRWSKEKGFSLSRFTPLGEISHVFSHRHWIGNVVVAEVDEAEQRCKGWEWVKMNVLFTKTFPVVYQKVIKMALDKNESMN
jgi:adenine-specific DNA glycosylase